MLNGQITIVKLGGKVLSDAQRLSAALKSFVRIQGVKILVHGGGRRLNNLLRRLGMEPKMIGGRRITDENALEAALMVYAGLENKKIVADLQALKCPAIGLSGADAGIILAQKRPVDKIDYGFVGDIRKVNALSIRKLLQTGFVPVFCALTHDGKGQMLNTNADTIASAIAAALAAFFHTRLIFAFEKRGVLEDPANEKTIIRNLDLLLYQKLKKNQTINEGMLPKLDNAFQALNAGVEEVLISRYDQIADMNNGTRITIQ